MSIIKDNSLVDLVVLDLNNIVCVLCTFYIALDLLPVLSV